MRWAGIVSWLMSSVTVPIWGVIAIFIGGLVADLVLKAVSWEMGTNRRLAQIDHEMEQDNKDLW